MDRLPLDVARCIPSPSCHQAGQCARYRSHLNVVEPTSPYMNAMPFRVDGQPCEWFAQRVEATA